MNDIRDADEELHATMMAWVSLVHVSSFLTGALEDQLRLRLRISQLEQEALAQLSKVGGSRTMTEFAQHLLLSKAGVTKLVDRLEKAELAQRVPSPSDRRATLVKLTAKGRRVHKRACKIIEEWVPENFGGSLDRDEIEEMLASFKKVLQAHGRWQGQLAYLRGEGPRGSHDERPRE